MTAEQRKPKFALVAQEPDDDAEEDEGEEDEDEVDSPLALRAPPQAKITEGEEEEDESDDLTISKESPTVSNDNTNIIKPTPTAGGNDEKKYENYVNTINQAKGQQAHAVPSPNTPLEKKIHELNDSLRKNLAKKVTNLFESTNKELLQTSTVLNRTLTTTRDTLDNVSKLNGNIATLAQKLETLRVPI